MKTDPEYYHLLRAFLEVEVNNQLGKLDPNTFEVKKEENNEMENEEGAEPTSKLFEIEEDLLPIIALIVSQYYILPY